MYNFNVLTGANWWHQIDVIHNGFLLTNPPLIRQKIANVGPKCFRKRGITLITKETDWKYLAGNTSLIILPAESLLFLPV